MTIPMADLIGYQMLELLYASAKTLVYRGRRCSDSRSVIIKLLRNEYPSIGELVKFRNQYQIAKSLSLPGIIQPYSLEPYLNGYALIMEDFGGISLRQWLGNRLQAVGAGNFLALDDFFNIALQLVEVLNELYQHRVIHKDIKPSNILINPETRQVKLTDFSLASLLARETQTLQTLNILEGTLAYLSPEQTGRMNRGIDYRTDFYSLGVTFYELLTGNLPFPSRDPMELVHCHIAKLPPSLQSHNPEIPLALSAIVGKLMAKNAEDRYQSALGLKYDLEQCQRFWREQRTIPEFAVGQRDVSDRLLIPEKLYGREQEVAAILAAFERVAGETECQAWGTETQEQGSGNQKQGDVSTPFCLRHHFSDILLGWWILQESCEQLSHWCDQFPQAFPVMMNVNLSAIQLKQTDLLERLESILQTTQIPRDCLKLEITESCILEPLTPEAQRLKQLKDLGVRLCIDDFGTGYSSLTRLREFPIDTLKIDRIFVHRLTRNYSQMVQMIISLAHSLGIDVVAEGIETETELETLKDLGCEFGQGYLFSPPIDPQEATQWLRQDMTRHET